MRIMKCRINNNQPNAAQRKALKQECKNQFDALTENFEHDVNVKLFYLFHFKYGFGFKRLMQLSKDMKELFDGLHSRYELPEGEDVWLCKKKLEDDGINVDELLKE